MVKIIDETSPQQIIYSGGGGTDSFSYNIDETKIISNEYNILGDDVTTKYNPQILSAILCCTQSGSLASSRVEILGVTSGTCDLDASLCTTYCSSDNIVSDESDAEGYMSCTGDCPLVVSCPKDLPLPCISDVPPVPRPEYKYYVRYVSIAVSGVTNNGTVYKLSDWFPEKTGDWGKIYGTTSANTTIEFEKYNYAGDIMFSSPKKDCSYINIIESGSTAANTIPSMSAISLTIKAGGHNTKSMSIPVKTLSGTQLAFITTTIDNLVNRTNTAPIIDATSVSLNTNKITFTCTGNNITNINTRYAGVKMKFVSLYGNQEDTTYYNCIYNNGTGTTLGQGGRIILSTCVDKVTLYRYRPGLEFAPLLINNSLYENSTIQYKDLDPPTFDNRIMRRADFIELFPNATSIPISVEDDDVCLTSTISTTSIGTGNPSFGCAISEYQVYKLIKCIELLGPATSYAATLLGTSYNANTLKINNVMIIA